jgi:hypothetical protein
MALRAAGIASVNPSHPMLLVLLEAGATVDEFLAAVEKAKDKRDPFRYLLGVVESQRTEAAGKAASLHRGVMPAPMTARAASRAAAVAELTGGMLTTTPPTGARMGDVIDMEANDGTTRRLG